ncbi:MULTISPECIES: LPXTG cell wall anchor domain-containing protein [Microvirga]|uniref:LPXTG cell wall anchor domain-containing protein n=1 Tax=Microvirga TaxID=186650 RepID=UPI0021C90212|nr:MULTISPECIES: LPXTG cell wall anchor domain-containing protein [unclassified Microvirga]
MAMDPMDREPNVYNRETNVYDNTGRGSNTLAYVIGGLVVALGLLAFLFYDGGSNEPSTTGSTGTQTERSSPSTGATAPATPTSPAAPAAPAAPATPSSPSAPANPQ